MVQASMGTTSLETKLCSRSVCGIEMGYFAGISGGGAAKPLAFKINTFGFSPLPKLAHNSLWMQNPCSNLLADSRTRRHAVHAARLRFGGTPPSSTSAVHGSHSPDVPSHVGTGTPAT